MSVSLAFVRGIHRWPVNSPQKSQWRGKCFHLMMSSLLFLNPNVSVCNTELPLPCMCRTQTSWLLCLEMHSNYQTQCGLKSLHLQFTVRQWFCITFLYQVTWYKTADKISLGPLVLIINNIQTHQQRDAWCNVLSNGHLNMFLVVYWITTLTFFLPPALLTSCRCLFFSRL